MSVRFSLDNPTPDSINETLLRLEDVATDHDIRFALILDEFQKVSELKENDVIEGAIRNAVQKAQCITYIFSGSQRSLLEQMFTQKKRPLYRLCTQMVLNRIESRDYEKYLNNVAKLSWGKVLGKDKKNGIGWQTTTTTSALLRLCFCGLSLANQPINQCQGSSPVIAEWRHLP